MTTAPIAPAGSRIYPYHHETTGLVTTSAVNLFTHVDDHARLSSHMSKSSWMMGGGKMRVELDDDRGQRVGSRIRVAGRVFGVQLSLEEVVIDREPHYRKAWETTLPPRLLVIGHYRMGFEIMPVPNGSQLRVFIDYALPETIPSRWLGYLFGPFYAKWCTRRMVRDAATYFNHQRVDP